MKKGVVGGLFLIAILLISISTISALSLSDISNWWNNIFNGGNKIQLSPTSQGLVAYYSFDNCSKIGGDSSGNNLNGQGHGAYGCGVGKFGRSLSLDGNSYVQIDHNPKLNLSSNGGFTISYWVKTTGNSQMGLTKGIFGGNTGYFSFMDMGGHLSLSIYDSGGLKQNYSATSFNDGQWHLFTGVYLPQVPGKLPKMRVYKDAFQVGWLTVTPPITTNTYPLYLGAQRNANGDILSGFTGEIDDVRIYNWNMTGTDVDALYAASSDVTCTPLTCNNLGKNCGVLAEPECGVALDCGSCSAGQTCSSNVCVANSEICNDGIDNNNNGLIDCADTSACPSGTTCGTNKICQNSQCITPSQDTCTDSDVNSTYDDGKNPLVQGTVTLGTNSKSDSCYSSTVVNESFCYNNQVSSELINCPGDFSCANGRCYNASSNSNPSLEEGTIALKSVKIATDLCDGIVYVNCTTNSTTNSVFPLVTFPVIGFSSSPLMTQLDNGDVVYSWNLSVETILSGTYSYGCYLDNSVTGSNLYLNDNGEYGSSKIGVYANKTITKCSSSDDESASFDNCLLADGDSLDIGERRTLGGDINAIKVYCSSSGGLQFQKSSGTSCAHNYECSNNACTGGVCGGESSSSTTNNSSSSSSSSTVTCNVEGYGSISPGDRIDSTLVYCSSVGTLLSQKDEGASCSDSYECKTDRCSSGVCKTDLGSSTNTGGSSNSQVGCTSDGDCDVNQVCNNGSCVASSSDNWILWVIVGLFIFLIIVLALIIRFVKKRKLKYNDQGKFEDRNFINHHDNFPPRSPPNQGNYGGFNKQRPIQTNKGGMMRESNPVRPAMIYPDPTKNSPQTTQFNPKINLGMNSPNPNQNPITPQYKPQPSYKPQMNSNLSTQTNTTGNQEFKKLPRESDFPSMDSGKYIYRGKKYT